MIITMSNLSLRDKRVKKIANKNNAKFNFVKGDLTNNEDLTRVFEGKNNSNIGFSKTKITCIVNLAAQAGVSIHPKSISIYSI